MKPLWLLALLCGSLTNAPEQAALPPVTGKIRKVSVDRPPPDGGDPVFQYTYEVRTRRESIHEPFLAFYMMLEVAHGKVRVLGPRKIRGKDSHGAAELSLGRPEVNPRDYKRVKSSTEYRFDSRFAFRREFTTLAYRVELWHDGELLDAYEFKNTMALRSRKIDLAEDWFEHPGYVTRD